MSSTTGYGKSKLRSLALRVTAIAVAAFVVLWFLGRGRTLQADAPPAATLISPNGTTVAIGAGPSCHSVALSAATTSLFGNRRGRLSLRSNRSNTLLGQLGRSE